MHGGDRGGEFSCQRIGQPAALGEAVERLVLVEPRHLDRPFHRLAGAVERERTIGLARDRHDAAVELRREGAIDVELGEAGGLAPVQCRIIEKRIFHRALDLEHKVAGEKDRGGMGVDAADLLASLITLVVVQTVRLRVRKQPKHLFLVFLFLAFLALGLVVGVSHGDQRSDGSGMGQRAMQKRWQQRSQNSPDRRRRRRGALPARTSQTRTASCLRRRLRGLAGVSSLRRVAWSDRAVGRPVLFRSFETISQAVPSLAPFSAGTAYAPHSRADRPFPSNWPRTACNRRRLLCSRRSPDLTLRLLTIHQVGRCGIVPDQTRWVKFHSRWMCQMQAATQTAGSERILRWNFLPLVAFGQVTNDGIEALREGHSSTIWSLLAAGSTPVRRALLCRK